MASNNNVQILAGSASYWSPDNFNSGATLSNLVGLNFVFQAIGDKKVRLTVSGSLTMAVATIGTVAYNAIIPLSVLYPFARPEVGTGGSNIWQSSAGSSLAPLATVAGITIANVGLSVSGDSSNFLLKLFGTTPATIASTAINFSAEVEYYSH